MSEKRKGGASREREKNKKMLVAAGSSCKNIIEMFKKVENNLVKNIVSTYLF